jgi:hypothetical protein
MRFHAALTLAVTVGETGHAVLAAGAKRVRFGAIRGAAAEPRFAVAAVVARIAGHTRGVARIAIAEKAMSALAAVVLDARLVELAGRAHG